MCIFAVKIKSKLKNNGNDKQSDEAGCNKREIT